MSDEETQVPEVTDLPEVLSEMDRTTAPVIPVFRRDIEPSNLVLSAADLKEFAELVFEANERSREIEFQKRDANSFGSDEEARHHINSHMPVEYNYVARNGDSVQGLGIPNVDERAFPEDLNTIFSQTHRLPSVRLTDGREIPLRPLSLLISQR